VQLAPLAHWALLALLLVMPVSGWLMSSAGGVSIYWFGYVALPDLVPRDQQLFGVLKTAHHLLARALIAIVVVHVAAVVHHDLLRRDGVFRRMWPFARGT
jgi:cytochrome b561